MKNKQLLFNMIIAGMTLGTTWAIRGQFGHEQGAAWAGAVGAISVILISGRADWYSKLFKATLAAAIGWGLGGIMSYGLVVGYGRGTDFVNVYYGLLMLFVIGGLYGFIGGGLFGLTLTDSKDQRIKWVNLITGMVVSGIVTYFFLIIEWEWLMTPPRSEVWALCLGVAIFLTWFTIHHKHYSALRVATFAGLGGGFGFAFGNFLQVLGNVSEIPFNFWNVMEYSLGFFGGAGMAYGVFTSSWDSAEASQKKSSNLIPMLLVVLLIPFVVWQQTFRIEKLQKNYSELIDGNTETWAWAVLLLALFLVICHTIFILVKYHFNKQNLIQYTANEVKTFLFTHFALYAIFSLLITGAIVSIYRIEQYLYLVNYAIILMFISKLKPVFDTREINANKWGRNFLVLLLILAVLAVVAISIHGESPGMQKRFEF